MKHFVQALPLLLVGAIALHSACDSSGGPGDTSSVNVTTEPVHGDACNGGRPDGYCNSLGDLPETCECFDCVDTAYCNGTCNNDGTCAADEDCTCDDCYDPGCDGPPTDDTTGPGAGTPNGGAPSNGGAGNGGAPTTSTGGAPSNGGGGAAANGGAGGV